MATEAVPVELREIQAAAAGCIQSVGHLFQVVQSTLDSDATAELPNLPVALTAADEGALLAFNRRLLKLTHHLRTVLDEVKPGLDLKLADPADPMFDYEVEAVIDYQLREDDPDFTLDDDNYLCRRTVSLKLSHWEREDCAYGPLPAGLLAEPHCALFTDLYGRGYAIESPRLSFHDCLRIGQIFVDVQVWYQYELDLQDGYKAVVSQNQGCRNGERLGDV